MTQEETKARRLKANWLVAMVLIAALLIGGTTTIGAYRSIATDKDLCTSNADNRLALRRVLLFAKSASNREDEESVAFWNDILAIVPPITCEGEQPVEGPILSEPTPGG